MSPEIRLRFEKILKKYLPDISQEKIDALALYADLLVEWNGKINLVSRKQEEHIWDHQVIGSLIFLFHFRLQPGTTVVDIGTGGGLPGIPLAIIYPDSKFLLIDSIQKKITAVNDMIERLGLKNVTAVWSRAEELAQKSEHRQKYDYVVARAVAPVVDLIRWGRGFLVPADLNGADERRLLRRGSFVMLKGGDLSDELRAAGVKWKPRRSEEFALPFIEEVPELTDKKLIVVQL